MTRFVKCSIVGLLLFVFSESAWSQKSIDRADNAFKLQQYTMAVTMYQKAFTKVKSNNSDEKNRILFRIGECYRLSGQAKKALLQYKKALRASYQEKEPILLYHMGEIARFLEEYTEASEYYRQYIELAPDDPMGTMALEACENIEKWRREPTRHEVEAIRRLNSSQNDWAPRLYRGDRRAVAFTSAREGATGKKMDDWTGERFTDIFFSEMDQKGAWSVPQRVDEKGMLNTKANESDAFFTNDGNTVYFTLCANEKKKQNGCKIYTSSISEGEWTDPTEVVLSPDSLADCVHPSLSPDGRYLFFSSNMDGGMGDLDIWCAERQSAQQFGAPINLGETINTSGKEAWPMLKNDRTLYFASTGLGGLGGYDLFVSTFDENNQWSKAENLKYPMNSSGDDFGIVFFPGEENGLFCSNRKGSRGDDIWAFSLPHIQYSISGVVRNDQTMQLISKATVEILGSDGLSVQAYTNNKGFYRFDETLIKGNVTYKLSVSKPGFMEGKAMETTVDLKNGIDLVRDFSLKPLPKGPVVLPDILYDVAKWNLKEQYQDSLIGLIELLESNPRLVIELASHTDNRKIAMTNDSLSQYRAQEVVNYLILRGIDPGRLVAKGYGASGPRILVDDIVRLTRNGKEVRFSGGTILSEQYINSLDNKEAQEIAHQLNRRTEFSILRDDFIPGKQDQGLSAVVSMGDISADMRIPYRVNPNGLPELKAVVNGLQSTILYDSVASTPLIQFNEAMRLLKTGKINKNHFEAKEAAFDEDGDVLIHSIFVISHIKVGKFMMTDVRVKVVEELAAPLLIGKEVLKQIGTFELRPSEREIVVYQD